MYQDAGYGQNWEPTANNARRIDPYTRSCAILGSLFAVGLVLIIIVVLSLIPVYISHHSSTNTNNRIQTSKILINNYNLEFTPPFNNFDPQTILSNTNNQQALQAALTHLLQEDSILTSAVIEINTSTRKRRQISNSSNLIFDLNIIGSKPCSTLVCLNQSQSHAINLLTNLNNIIPVARYQQSDSTQIYWIYYRLPQTIQSNVSYVYTDPKTTSSLLNTLTSIDSTENQPIIQNSTSTLVS